MPKHRLPHHIFRLRDPKLRQDRRRNISQRRILRFNLAIADQHTRHQPGVDAVIATPRIRVVFQQLGWKPTQNRLPSGPIAAVVADQRVGTGTGIRALVDFARQVNLGNATIQAIPLASLVKCVQEMIAEDPLALLCNRPVCERCDAVRESVKVTDIPTEETPVLQPPAEPEKEE